MKPLSIDTTRRTLAFAFAALFVAFAPSAHAATPGTQYTDAARHAEAEWKAMRQKCNAMSGHENEVCEAKAKADYRTALADAEAKYKNTPDAMAEARKVRADTQYDLAKKQCEAKKGDDEDACMSAAKQAHKDALAESERQTKIAVANVKARDARQDSAYEAARERCKSLSGDEQDRCQKDAKDRFDK